MKTLVVTGASRGLGRAIAETATAEGHRVVGLARNADPGAGFELRPCDVGDAEQVKAAFKDLAREESLYGLINAAGIASMNLTVTMPSDTIERLVRTNLLGTIYCSQAVSRVLVRRKAGRIINFSTIAVPLAIKGEAVYAASKAGVEVFSRVLAKELSEHGVTVNTLAPGPIETDLIAKLDPSIVQAVVDQQVIARKATPEDVWLSVRYLLSPESAMISGQVLNIGGV